MISNMNGILFETISPSLYRMKMPPQHEGHIVEVAYLGQNFKWGVRMTKPDGTKFPRAHMTRAEAFGVITKAFSGKTG